VLDDDAQIALLKKGLYRFNADRDTVAVYDGKAKVYEGDESVEVKGGREVTLNGNLKPRKFDKKATEEADPLYAWSKLRSRYLSEASEASARTYVINNYDFPGAGWYWNPWYGAYAFLPSDPLLYSPFGWGYYSPLAFYGPYFYGPTYYRYSPRFPVGRGHAIRPPARQSPGINPGLVTPRGSFGHDGGGLRAPARGFGRRH
jgi:hypothetical protein